MERVEDIAMGSAHESTMADMLFCDDWKTDA